MCACGDNDGSHAVPKNLSLQADPAELALAPGQIGDVTFRLTDKSGRPRATDTVKFALVEGIDPALGNPGVAGASLLASEGITDGLGFVKARVRAGGLGAFRLRASWSGAGDLLVPVAVIPQNAAPASAVVVPAANTMPASVEMRLYEALGCPQVNVGTPPPPDPLNSRTMAVAAAWQLPLLAQDRNYALTARAIDQTGAVISFGCVQVNGSQLLQSTPVTLLVPLASIPVVLSAHYEASSEFAFAPQSLAQAQAVGNAWAQLSRCPGDPAQAWLDCTLDALGPTSPETPLDCISEADEGPVGQLLLAKRGVMLEDSGGCRAAVDAAGQPSAETQLFGLFRTPASGPLAALPNIAKAAAGLFAQIRFASSLELTPSGLPGLWVGTHTARSLGFSVGLSFYSVPVSSQPGRFSRFLKAEVNAAQTLLTLGAHGFGVRLGSAAHAAFRARVLSFQGFPSDERAFLEQLFGQATTTSTPPASGCSAMDALLCPQLGRPHGCLQTACTLGLQALAVKLTDGFAALDGADIDFVLEGTAPVLDRTVDGTVKGLGSLVPNRGGLGLWSAQIRGAAGNSALTGLWVATRTGGQ